jgi:hypothetical protein
MIGNKAIFPPGIGQWPAAVAQVLHLSHTPQWPDNRFCPSHWQVSTCAGETGFRTLVSESKLRSRKIFNCSKFIKSFAIQISKNGIAFRVSKLWLKATVSRDFLSTGFSPLISFPALRINPLTPFRILFVKISEAKNGRHDLFKDHSWRAARTAWRFLESIS